MQSYYDQMTGANATTAALRNMLLELKSHGSPQPVISLYPVANKLTVKLSNDGFNYTVSGGYTGNWPDLFLVSGMAYAFDIQSSGKKFAICDADTAEPLTEAGGHTFVHIAPSGNITKGDKANEGQQSGTLIWTVPADFNLAMYRSLDHGGSGNIKLLNLKTVFASQ